MMHESHSESFPCTVGPGVKGAMLSLPWIYWQSQTVLNFCAIRFFVDVCVPQKRRAVSHPNTSLQH